LNCVNNVFIFYYFIFLIYCVLLICDLHSVKELNDKRFHGILPLHDCIILLFKKEVVRSGNEVGYQCWY
jgi:hypothetical protein